MTQLSVAMLALQKDSKFNQQYQEGMKKDQYWAACREERLGNISGSAFIVVGHGKNKTI